MEWRPQSAVGYEAAYSEAQRWIEAVTKKKFGSSNFRSSLENGLLLCDLINKIRPGVVKKLNRLSTPIAGLDNINLFLKACAKLGLKEAQLFHPGDLQDLSTRVTVKPQESSRRLKNVLITIYWLGRKAHADPFYNGPYLKLKAFEGLLGTALYKALEDCTSLRGRVRNSSCRDSWYSEKEELFPLRAGHRREDSLDSLDSLGSRTYSTSSDATLKGNSEGCGSDPEADLSFMMSEYKEYRRSQVIAPKATTQYNQFLPSKEKQSGYVPAPLRKKRAERNDDNRRSWASPMYTEDDGSFTSPSHESAGSDPSSITGLKSQTAAHPSLAYEYESSDSDTDRMDPDMVLDDLASRRFHSHSSVAPTNFAIPMSQLEAAAIPCTTRSQVAVSNVSRQTLTHLSSQTQPLTVAQQSAGLHKLEPPDFWPRPDPASGPRLIKCEKRPLLGREHPNDPYNVSADILPDLENDDMFTRRTKTFHSSDDLAKLKYGNFLLPRRRSEADFMVVIQPRHEGEPVYPDIEKDDVVFRRAQQQISNRPLSGAPDNYHPVPIPEAWALPPKLQTKLICDPVEPRQHKSKPEIKHGAEQHLKTDDMLLRKLRALNTQGKKERGAPSVSFSCSDEDVQKWQAIREASRVRYWKRLMVESLLQKSSGIEGSKSVSDITDSETNLSNSTMELRFEELQKMRNRIKENEDKWQDDLTRWKNKRRSVNSDIVKKKEEREQIEQNTSGTRKSKTFKEMQDERESQEQSNYRDSFNSITDDVFEEPVPRSRTLPVRSYTIDTPYTPMDKPSVPSIPSLREKEPVAGTLASDQTDFSTKRDRSSPDIPLKMSNNIVESQTTTQSLLDDPVPAFSNSNSSLIKPTSAIKPTSVSKPSSILISSELISSTKPVKNSSGLVSSLYKPNSMDIKQSGLDQVSASLPRSYQRSDSARLTSVVTPRPFGTQSNRIASLPRAFTMDDSLKRTNGETDSLKKTTVSNRSAQYVKDEDTSQESPVQSSDEEEKTQSPVPPFNRVSSLPKSPSPLIPPNEVDYSEMRISLNQKPNSSRDFGFQSDWDSTGVRVKTVVPGSPAQHGQVKVGDEILTVNGHRVADMNYNEWKNSMAEALQQGSLLMDICRHGKNNWGRDLPSLPFKSHKTINLTSLDPLGPSEPYLSTSLDFTSQQTKDTVVKTVNVSSQPGNNYGSNGINGGFHEDSETVNNKESESITMKNLKRRSEFFEQGGSDTAISNLPIPSITTSTERYSWDPEEERRRHEKWQKEQERLLQEKYKKDQEKLDEEWRKAQKELEKESFKKHEEEMLRLEEERRKREEQEHLEEEKKKREEERKKREEERLRLEEERRKRQEQERFEEEKKKREEEEMKKRELERLLLEEKRRRREEQEHLEEQRRKREEEERFLREKERNRREEERRRLEEQKRFQEQDHSKVDYFGYTNVYPQLSYSHRSISKSTPELDEVEKPDIKAASSGLGEFSRDYKKEPLSQSEVERQQILQEMKKKTSLNTDNSWIRQQTSAGVTAKEPIDLPIRRGESLDNLDMPRSSWSSSWSTSNSTSSIPDYSRPHSSLSGSLSHQSGRPGSATLQSSQSMSSLRQSWSPSAPTPEPEPRVPPRNRSVSGRKICSFCNTPLGKGAAMIIESLGLCYHLSCFKCFNCRSDLGGSEAGAEVRIRNQQLYCNACYIRLKTGQPTAL
ncbi:LIM domain only protein 7-like isoform X10 [Sinocyclocheilus rhinocerous]|uniref:LIM domain only protein 7-like isoform X10 n=1 Tax=Sinocyclocheilus rhinocerous TaxID=307959 RepID=UPI0007BA7236|nr:PREDICTED: LIM domain only protein 7-like isoform X10 [Sinocyclocheilus rhinocerous]